MTDAPKNNKPKYLVSKKNYRPRKDWRVDKNLPLKNYVMLHCEGQRNLFN